MYTVYEKKNLTKHLAKLLNLSKEKENRKINTDSKYK